MKPLLALFAVALQAQTVRINPLGPPFDFVGSSSGVTTASGMTDCAVTRTSSTVLTIGAASTASAPCRVGVGNVVYSFSSPATATISAGSATVYIFVSSAGVLSVGKNGDTVACSSCTATADTGFPSTAKPIWTWTATSGTWDSTGGVDQRAWMSIWPVIAGSGLTCSMSSGITTCAIDTSSGTLVPASSSSPASGAACTAGNIAWDTSYIYVCTASGAWKRAALTGGY